MKIIIGLSRDNEFPKLLGKNLWDSVGNVVVKRMAWDLTCEIKSCDIGETRLVIIYFNKADMVEFSSLFKASDSRGIEIWVTAEGSENDPISFAEAESIGATRTIPLKDLETALFEAKILKPKRL